MPKRKRKKYSKPQRPFDKARIEEENILKEKYGLKNKKEIWKADVAIGRIRNLAKQLITKSEKEKKSFIEKLQEKGFKAENIADALALDKEDWLKRRLQTMVFTKKLSLTPKQARQFIVHKKVSIGNQKVNIPSYQVGLGEEPLIKLDLSLKLQKPKKEIEKKPILKAEKEIEKDIAEKEEKIEKEAEEAEKEIDKEISERISKKEIEKDIAEKAKEIGEEEKQVEKEIKKEADEKIKEIEEKIGGEK